MIVREFEPANLEYPFARLDGLITPHDQFYVRSHYPTPQLDPATWRLTIKGEVEHPLTLGYEDLLAMPAQTLTVTLECAGNQRVFLTPPADGVQWSHGAVGTATWTGVPLADVLARVQPTASALEVIAVGADCGVIKKAPKPAGPVPYARSLPLATVELSQVLLAYAMNGRPLSPAHGFPLRLIVPGWYGMAAVKWLTRLVLTAQPFQGYYQSVDYAFWQRIDDLPTRVPISLMQTKAAIARPTMHEVIPRHRPYRVFGAAWTGSGEIVQVLVSVDGGQQWHEATLLGEAIPYTWRLWEFMAPPFEQPGSYTVMARAVDSNGGCQPLARSADYENYQIAHVLPIPIEVQ